MSRQFPELELEAGRLEEIEFSLTDRKGNPLPIEAGDELYFDIKQAVGGPSQLGLSNVTALAGGSVIEITSRGNDSTTPKLQAYGKIKLFGSDTNDLAGLYFGAFDLMDDSEPGNAIKPISRGMLRFNDNVTRP